MWLWIELVVNRVFVCALTVLYIRIVKTSAINNDLHLLAWVTPAIRITDMMYASNSPPPWRAGTPRASFSSLQQQHHAAVEPVQHHHQDKLYILGKIAMKKSSWSRSGLSFSLWFDLVLACITAFGVFGCTAFIILPINFEGAPTNSRYIWKHSHIWSNLYCCTSPCKKVAR